MELVRRTICHAWNQRIVPKVKMPCVIGLMLLYLTLGRCCCVDKKMLVEFRKVLEALRTNAKGDERKFVDIIINLICRKDIDVRRLKPDIFL